MRGAAALAVVSLLAPAAPHARGAGPGDPLQSKQWALAQLHAERAWAVTTGKSVLVAVVDSGTDANHPDLRGAVLPGRDMLTGRPGQKDGCGHGTEVAGVIAARRGNGRGIVGIAPSARILPLKVGDCVDVDGTAVVAAIRYAVAQGVKVINLSHATIPLTGQASAAVGLQDALQAAVDEAWSRGVLVVASAGNLAVPLCTYPGLARRALCVGAVDRAERRTYYSEGSSVGTDGFLVAPGGGPTLTPDDGIWTTTVSAPADSGDVSTGEPPPFPGYAEVQGTSYAAPYVSGVAALLFSRGLSVQEVRTRLLSTARDLGAPGSDVVYGAGLIDAPAALAGRR